MNVVINDFNVNTLDLTKLTTMKYLHDYLDDSWKITKNKNTYILKKHCNKIIIDDNIRPHVSPHVNGFNNPLKYILCLLYNVLNTGWSIKKNNNRYIFLKKHEGKTEYLSDDYLVSFMKEHFNSNLIN